LQPVASKYFFGQQKSSFGQSTTANQLNKLFFVSAPEPKRDFLGFKTTPNPRSTGQYKIASASPRQ